MLRLVRNDFKKEVLLIRRYSEKSQPHTNQEKDEKELQDVISSIRKNFKKRKQVLAELRGNVEVKTLDEIEEEADRRYHQRFIKPSLKWKNKITKSISETMTIDPTKRTFQVLKESLDQIPTNLAINEFFSPLDLGDVVELSTSLNQSGLALIVELPSKEDDPRYTVMNRLGELSYLEKSHFKFRIPQFIPKDRLQNLIYKVPEGEDAEDYGSIKPDSSGFTKYAVNPNARSFIMKPVLDITNEAWKILQEISRKLEIIHKLIQNDSGPKEVSVFVLVKALDFINLKKFKESIENTDLIDYAYENLRTQLAEKIGKEFSDKSFLGKSIGKISTHEEFSVVKFYAVILALRKQSMLWSNSYSSKSSLIPLTITALPLHYTKKLAGTSDLLKFDHRVADEFSDFVDIYYGSKNLPVIPPKYTDIFYLLKEYAIGNVKDPKIETIVSLLMKKQFPDQDVTRSLVYQLLVEFRIIQQDSTNPTHFSTKLCIPGKQVSTKADLEQQYYDSTDLLDFSYDLARKRTDLTHLDVFCIDSESAHEIDDGVSLEKIDEENYKLYIHVADPSSFIKRDSSLFNISYERSFTIYQPELISAMLPSRISDIAGLGKNGRKTRAITFSVPLNIKDGKIDFRASKVEASYISKFPHGYFYSKVDKILDKQIKPSSDVEYCEFTQLFEMYKVGEALRLMRVKNGGIIFGESIGVQLKTTENDDLEISQQEPTKSNLLVSEFMILANRISGEYLAKNNIPGVYKVMHKLPLFNENIFHRLNQLSLSSDHYPRLSEIVKLFKFISAANYSAKSNQSHFMLGCINYAPSTSPLRRVGDLINHYQFHTFLNEENLAFSNNEVLSMVLHIESKNDIIRKTNLEATSYYTINKLKRLIGTKEIKELDLIISSKILDGGYVFAIIKNFGIMSKLKFDTNKAPPNIGDEMKIKLINEDYNFEFIEFDPVGNSVLIKEL
ncbi:hypothetical protein WICMUC_005581 [Wickerhamomyces mucosus]|uniref:RNB domain-containing protein n=1 Tax=Wickerhamomyces mucosus TaxID=1378264 RepID=A0A9P8P861_9ASCO|nr:hypothetical protein WICMUC_005581 [Wickerhamomyces mucosus]